VLMVDVGVVGTDVGLTAEIGEPPPVRQRERIMRDRLSVGEERMTTSAKTHRLLKAWMGPPAPAPSTEPVTLHDLVITDRVSPPPSPLRCAHGRAARLRCAS
jgi:hypothetical protein